MCFFISNLNFYIKDKRLFLSILIEILMVLIFLEIIELNFCGLNENLIRNIELRSFIDSSLIKENEKDEFDKK